MQNINPKIQDKINKIIYFGVDLVITQPDKKVGRKRRI